jgi:folate-binding protein YgfZ
LIDIPTSGVKNEPVNPSATPEAAPRPLALDEIHRAAGASFAEAGGRLVPRDYGDLATEHAALSTGVGIVDRSALGRAEVTGRDRAAFLQGMLTNDVKGLAPGQGCGAAFLDAHGKVMSLLAVYALPDRLWLELPEGMTERTLQLLDKYLISEKAEFEPIDDAFAIAAVQGPRAPALLAELTGQALDLPPYGHLEAAIAGAPVRVINRAEAAVPGFHCWVPSEHAAAVWQALRAAGATPVGRAALDVLRVEAGVPWYGPDVDESVIMPETGLESLVHYQKGCYIGQEVVARVKYRGHVNRRLAGLRVEGDRAPAPGATVLAGDREIGRITSAVRSRSVGAPVALAYLRREHWEPGSPVEIRDGEARLAAHVAALPFAASS